MVLKIEKDVPLAPFTTFGIGGPADFFCIATSREELIDAITFAREKNISFFLLGSGANILVGDKGFRGLVIKNEAHRVTFQKNENNTVFLTAESGAVIADLIQQTVEKGLSGLEHFAGIPSTLGGAIWQNLHFLSPDRNATVFIGDIVESAEILQIKNSRHSDLPSVARMIVDRDYFHFQYDYSILHDTRDVLLSATLKLLPEDTEVLKKRVAANIVWRGEKHPENSVKTSAGSIFKKIEGHGAGRLIQQVGLKGKIIGGAQISPKHANFIVNTGSATAKDVRDIISLVQMAIKETLGLTLETEISFVGEF